MNLVHRRQNFKENRIFKGLFLINRNTTAKAAFSDHKKCYSLTKNYRFLELYIITKIISCCQTTTLVYHAIETR